MLVIFFCTMSILPQFATYLADPSSPNRLAYSFVMNLSSTLSHLLVYTTIGEPLVDSLLANPQLV